MRKQVIKQIIVEARLQNLSMFELGKKLGLPQSRISEITRGKAHLMSLEKLLQLYSRLGGTYKFVLYRPKKKSPRAKSSSK